MLEKNKEQKNIKYHFWEFKKKNKIKYNKI